MLFVRLYLGENQSSCKEEKTTLVIFLWTKPILTLVCLHEGLQEQAKRWIVNEGDETTDENQSNGSTWNRPLKHLGICYSGPESPTSLAWMNKPSGDYTVIHSLKSSEKPNIPNAAHS